MKHEKFIGKGEKRWSGLVRKGKRKAAKACGFPFFVRSKFYSQLNTPYTPMMSLVRSSTTGMVMRMMPMKSMMTPDLIIFVMGTYPEA